jgi:hypothetical protein
MNWIINSLSVMNSPEPETVVMSNFTINDTQSGLTGSVTYSVNLLPNDGKNFIPYADITQAEAIQWTQDALGADRVAAMEAEVQALIDAQKVPTPQPAPLPWVPVEATTLPAEVAPPAPDMSAPVA